MYFEPLSNAEEEIGKAVVQASYDVHDELGPGLLEKIYEICLMHELRKNGLEVKRQVDVPIEYDGMIFKDGLRLDLLVESKVIIEVKAVEVVSPIWQAQILSQMKLTEIRLGYLINFNVSKIQQGIKRFIR
jgi:GxxExxY protein